MNLRCFFGFHLWKVLAFLDRGMSVRERCERCGDERITATGD